MSYSIRLIPLLLLPVACNWPFPVDGGEVPGVVLPGDGSDDPAPEPACLFGDSFYQLRHAPEPTHDLTLSADEWIRADGDLTDPVERAQLIRAVQQSSNADVTTVADALSRVDENEVRRFWITTDADEPTYVVYEYGAGDNSYGAIFIEGDTSVVANIHDGDIENCLIVE